MRTVFLDLSIDLILEICSYFSIGELYYSFYPDCLRYLFEILKISHMRLHLDLTHDDLRTDTILSLIDINQILSLHLFSCSMPQMVFYSVKALTLNNVNYIHPIISQTLNLSVLERLILINSSPMSNNDFSKIFAHSSLKYLKIESCSIYTILADVFLEQSSTIEQLILNTSCSYDTLKFFLKTLPNLHMLRVRTLFDTQTMTRSNRLAGMNMILPSIISHSSLRTLHLVWYHPTVTAINILLTGFTNLKQFRLSGIMNFEELNGKLWHDLLTKTSLNLWKMNVNMLVWAGDQGEIIERNFDQDTFFDHLDFQLFPRDKENRLFVFFGDFQQRFIE